MKRKFGEYGEELPWPPRKPPKPKPLPRNFDFEYRTDIELIFALECQKTIKASPKYRPSWESA